MNANAKILLAFLLGSLGGFVLAPFAFKSNSTGFVGELSLEAAAIDSSSSDFDSLAEKTAQLATKTNQLATKTNQLATKTNQVTSLSNQLATKTSQLATKINQVTSLTNQLATKTSQLATKTADLAKLTADHAELAAKWANLPNLLQNRVVNPIVGSVSAATSKITEIESFADGVADDIVEFIKDLNFIPASGAQLAGKISEALAEPFKEPLCVPWTCLAEKFGLQLEDIVLYSTPKVSIGTDLYPSTCIQFGAFKLKAAGLDKLLSHVRDLALDIYKQVHGEVKEEITKAMNAIKDKVNYVSDKLQSIDVVAKGAKNLLGLNDRRRMLEATFEDGHQAYIDHVIETAHVKGAARFEELYAQRVQEMFHERKLGEKGSDFIDFDSLELIFTQDFNQTFSLDSSDRTGFADSIFDEALEHFQIIPVPPFQGAVNIVLTGSLKAAMPYAMAIEGAAKASFGYGIGETQVILDLAKGTVKTKRNDFYTDIDIDASVGLSGYMALNFAASTSVALCMGQTQNACVTVSVDAHQEAAAGFDAVAGLSYGDYLTKSLTTMYTDELDYQKQPRCNDRLSVGVGYWQYVKAPYVTVAITGPTCCKERSDVLYEYQGDILQRTIHSHCLGTDYK
ncbi:unknown protein [Seminavis robusta]|uniref:Uncharacterized protein n=1 Tax=Seminavis robusta TaxID=568900 RepID=A0A9N8E8P9_9STRA|nr:unknown protein [Seminavis robusta]|eukprot:Sro669_g184490.1 n/a (625) ;mRNA; f:13812-16042